jgi:exopolyphosphatase/pppGpp-phosphohydrolase
MNEEAPDGRLLAVMQLAQTCEYDAAHTRQVTHLALRLFDELQSLHTLGPQEREWLHFAALLHDIGWIEGWKEHHKVSLRIILTTPLLPFANKERLMIGSIARYHRKSLPDLKHDHYSTLSENERRIVDILAGMLRLADGLDSSHQGMVLDLACKVSPKKLVLKCAARASVKEEMETALEKSDLLGLVLHRNIEIKWEDIS